MVPQFIQF